jgi:nucleotide-binding universal stress UspA family protein
MKEPIAQAPPMRVVVGVDFSEPSTEAARWTARWLPEGSELILAHVLVLPEMDMLLRDRFPVSPSVLENARLGADRRLKELSASIGHPRTWVEIREGRPADAIAELAKEFKASLIVVGAHGEGGHARGYPGRTADNLVRSSRIPVLLATQAGKGIPKRILVALTFSSITPYVLEWTAKLAQRFDARVHGIHVIASAVLSHVLSMAAVTHGKAEMTEEEVGAVFADEKNQWSEQLVAAGIPIDRITTEVVFGEVSGAILGAVDSIEGAMVVMGTHAGPVRRALLGSAASSVLRGAKVPVLVVPEPESTPA